MTFLNQIVFLPSLTSFVGTPFAGRLRAPVRVVVFVSTLLFPVLMFPFGLGVEFADCVSSLYYRRGISVCKNTVLFTLLSYSLSNFSLLQIAVFLYAFFASCLFLSMYEVLAIKMRRKRYWEIRNVQMREREKFWEEREKERRRRMEEREAISLFLHAITADKTEKRLFLPHDLRFKVWEMATCI